MKVSVIIPTYNRPAVLRRTLESVSALEPQPDEILVIDQSDVEDFELAKFIDQAQSGAKVRYIRQRPPNAEAARNRAVQESTGDLLLFLDDDILVENDLVAAHVKNYSDPSIGAVGGFFLEPGEKPTDHLPPDYYRKYTGWIYLPHCFTRRCDSGLFPSCNGSIRREVLLRSGGFDENYIRTLLDDTDLSCRLRQLGVRIVHDPEARALHLKEPSGGKRPGGVNQYVIADSAAWQVWCYFFLINFGRHGWRELVDRLRRCVFRRVNIVRPWYLAIALFHFVRGAARAVGAIRAGRMLPLREESVPLTPIRA